MELAKITSKGQITIPIDIRRKLGLKPGDKILFYEKDGNICILNPSLNAFHKAQDAFKGEAERAGIKHDEDVKAIIKEIREIRRRKEL